MKEPVVIMTSMKRFVPLLFCAALLAPAAELSAVRKVYLLPMQHGMDQFLANRVTNLHLFEVVTDPMLADAFFTDHLGEGFEARMTDLTTPPPPPSTESKAKAEDTPTTTATAPSSPMSMLGDTVNKLANPSTNSTFSRGKGTLFLVDTKSKEVVWSMYAPPRDSSGKEMDRTASAIVSRLNKDLKPNQK